MTSLFEQRERNRGLIPYPERKHMQTIIAVDPGMSGGIAYSIDTNPSSPTAYGMPDTEGDILDELKSIQRNSSSTPIAFIEQNTGFAGVKIPSHTMFKLGRNTGFLIGAMQALGFRIEPITAKKWQEPLSLGTARSCASKTEWKNKLKAKAQQLYPHLKVTLQTADALLILEYGRRMQK